MAQQNKLPAGHKFTMYRNEDGVYTLESQLEKGLLVYGHTPDEAVLGMAETIPDWEAMKVWLGDEYKDLNPDEAMNVLSDFLDLTSPPGGRGQKVNVDLDRAYIEHADEALKLYKDFEPSQLEILSRNPW